MENNFKKRYNVLKSEGGVSILKNSMKIVKYLHL